MKRWRGLRELVTTAVDAGTTSVEKVQLGLAKRTFDVLEAIPVVAPPARVVHVVHDVSVRSVYSTIRMVNRGVGAGLDIVLSAIEEDRASQQAAGERAPDP